MNTKTIIASLAIVAVLTGSIASAQVNFNPIGSDFYAQIQNQLNAVRTQMNSLLSSLGLPTPSRSGTVQAPANTISGTVKSVSGDTIIVTGRDGVEYTVNAAGATINGGIAAGKTIVAGGTFASGSTTTLNATTIKVANASSSTAVLRGTISAINGSTFTVQSMSKNAAANIAGYVGSAESVVVSTDSTTIFKKNGLSVTFSDLALGQNIVVNGKMTGTDTATASHVYVISLDHLSSAMNMTMTYGVSGTVKSVSGTTITVTGYNGTEYTVDASSATITKSDRTSAQVSDIKAGDMVAVAGNITGTSVAATQIYVMAAGSLTQVISSVSGSGTVSMLNNVLGMVSSIDGTNGSGADVSMPIIMFNGTVKSISGTTLVVNGYGDVDYTVDAANASITNKIGQTATLSIVQVGDSVVVAGKKGATTVTATLIGDISR